MSDLDLSDILEYYSIAITTADINSVVALNEGINLDELSYDQFIDFLSKLTEICYENNQSEICSYILQTKDSGSVSDTDTYLPIITGIFSAYMEQEVYDFIRDSLTDFVYVDHMINLLHHDSSEENLMTAVVITNTYKVKGITREDYASIIGYYSENESAGNKKIYNFVVERIKDVSEYQDYPSYYQHYDLSMSFSVENTNKVYRTEKEIFDIAEEISNSVALIYIPYLKEIAPPLPEFTIDTSESIDEFGVSDDIRLFRILGPRNPKDSTFYDDYYQEASSSLVKKNELDLDLRPNKDLCTSYGGCRMLTCVEFEKGEGIGDFNDQETVDDVEFGGLSDINSNRWFHGSCDICAKKITNKRCALRMALRFGGWRGCYCSLLCLVTDIPDNDETRVMTELNTRFHTMLKKFGICETGNRH